MSKDVIPRSLLAEASLSPSAISDLVEGLPACRQPTSPAKSPQQKKRQNSRRAALRTVSAYDIARMTPDEVQTLLQALRWPETGGKPVCPQCGHDRCGFISTRQKFRCSRGKCRYEFTVTTGTVWHSHNIPLGEMLLIAYLFACGKKGVSSAGLSDIMQIDTKTARLVTLKMREAIARSREGLKLSGVVEIDGVYLKAKRRPPNLGRGCPKQLVLPKEAPCVLTLAQRDGPVVAVVVSGETKEEILEAVRRYVEPSTTLLLTDEPSATQLMTDDLPSYDFLRAYFPVRQVNHSVCFAWGSTHTNNAETFHQRIRRAQKGIYHRFASGPDVDLYLHELAWRHGNRGMDTRTVWENLVACCIRGPESRRFQGAYQY